MDAQLKAVRDLAHVANVDISPCTNVREQILKELPDRLIKELKTCIKGVKKRASLTTKKGRKHVDIIISKIHNMESELFHCGKDLLCIAPLLKEIELDKFQLPENVDTEVLAVDNMFTTLRLSVQSCSDSKV